MAALICKMCGGTLALTEDSNVCECEFCGTRQTVPTADSDKKTTLFNRANRLRMNAEFDKAAAVYESIVAEFPAEAEAYWGLCLCAYGIEYVDDPATGEKMPTCHRTLPTSIMEDSNFVQACDNADAVARRLYREEAKAIDRIQKDILTIVGSEKPYDVFICYKETDENGDRTEDSVLAQEIYDALTAKGLKVFFSRITLEDKLGQQYEPYIYAALVSARVLVAVGTKFEYYDAVWVKNEWMRFLSMMRTDRTKTLIPCYKDLDAYDMPKEFRQLQAQDMDKLGWLQDLTRGVMKLCGKEGGAAGAAAVQAAPMIQQAAPSGNPTVDSLLQRAQLFLEDEKWEEANEYADRVLDASPKCAPAYVIKVCCTLHLKKEAELKDANPAFTDNSDWQKAVRFAAPQQKTVYEDYAEQARQKVIYDKAVWMRQVSEQRKPRRPSDLDETAKVFFSVSEYKDAREQGQACTDAAEAIRASMYDHAVNAMNTAGEESGKWALAKERLAEAELTGYRDVDELRQKAEKSYEACRAAEREAARQAEELRQRRAAAAAAKKRRMIAIAILATIIVIAVFLAITRLILPKQRWRTVGSYVTFGKYAQTASGNDQTPVEWLVLHCDAANHRVLIISRYGLDVQPYNESNTSTTWEHSTMRTWLNNDFMKKAFSADEQRAIITTNVQNGKNQDFSGWKSNGGYNTKDQIFLLSYAEANKYFNVTRTDQNNTASRVKPTAYAHSKGAWLSSTNKTTEGAYAGRWWLRSSTRVTNFGAYVNSGGYLFQAGVNYNGACVRPAMWVDLNKIPF